MLFKNAFMGGKTTKKRKWLSQKTENWLPLSEAGKGQKLWFGSSRGKTYWGWQCSISWLSCEQIGVYIIITREIEYLDMHFLCYNKDSINFVNKWQCAWKKQLLEKHYLPKRHGKDRKSESFFFNLSSDILNHTEPFSTKYQCAQIISLPIWCH